MVSCQILGGLGLGISQIVVRCLLCRRCVCNCLICNCFLGSHISQRCFTIDSILCVLRCCLGSLCIRQTLLRILQILGNLIISWIIGRNLLQISDILLNLQNVIANRYQLFRDLVRGRFLSCYQVFSTLRLRVRQILIRICLRRRTSRLISCCLINQVLHIGHRCLVSNIGQLRLRVSLSRLGIRQLCLSISQLLRNFTIIRILSRDIRQLRDVIRNLCDVIRN